MSTFERFDVGDVITTPARPIADDALEVVRALGGYVHPLFNDESYAHAAGFTSVPLPGELVLFILGGMAEQSEVFDDTTIALTRLDDVRFIGAVHVGDTIALAMEVIAKRRSTSGRRGSLTLRWRCTNQDAADIVRADATLLFRVEP